MTVDIRVKYTPSEGFTNVEAVAHYMDYLFRTDAVQKWTTDKTKDNQLVILDGDRLIMYPFNDIQQSEHLKLKSELLLQEALGQQSKAVLRHDVLHYVCYDIATDTPLAYHQLDNDEWFNFNQRLVLHTSKDLDAVFFVVHVDESEDEHIHSVFLDNQKNTW